jgi:HEPN domain-containing protein
MRDIKQARAMLRMAHKDFAALVGMARDVEAFADEIFGFHAQQAVEKGLKAWICLHGIEYPFTHQLVRLLTILMNNGEDMELFWSLEQYSVFSVQARYEEGDVALDEPLHRDAVIAEVHALLDKVDALVGQFDVAGTSD